jgi:parallel beta-helix repeat protein
VDIKGCNFAIEGGSGGALISSGCGKDVSDTIVIRRNHYFDDEKHDIIYLNSGLPFVDDSQPTIITGEYSAYPVILDFSGDDNTNGLVLVSNNNVLKNITIRGGRCSDGKYCDSLEGLSLIGNGNQVSNVLIHDFQGQGIRVEGDNNVLDNVRVGVPAGNVTKCPLKSLPDETTGMSGHGIYLTSIAQGTVIKNSVIGCNGLWSDGAGIYVSSGNSGTVIGPGNKIGTIGNGSSVLLGNASSGVLLNGAQNVTVISNTIGYNGNSGIALYNSSNNVIGGNVIRDNGVDGITLAAASHNNKVGGPMVGSSYGGNKIGFNNAHGINVLRVPAISLASPTGNQIAGNWVGTLNSVAPAPNKGSGIVLNTAVDNQIGEPAPAAPNIVGSNQGQGIWLRAAAKDNTVLNTYVGTNGFTALPNLLNGILIEEGSNGNMIGGLATNTANLIYQNNEAGILLRGAGTSSNTLLRNTDRKSVV